MFMQMAWRVVASRRRKLRSLAIAHRSPAARGLFGAKSGLASAMLLSGCTWFSPDAGIKLSDLKKLERLLAKTVARCSGKKAPNCPVLDILDIRR
jgi:hypothetical protein